MSDVIDFDPVFQRRDRQHGGKPLPAILGRPGHRVPAAVDPAPGARVVDFACDVRDAEAVTQLFADIASRRGNPDLLPEHLVRAIIGQDDGIGGPHWAMALRLTGCTPRGTSDVNRSPSA